MLACGDLLLARAAFEAAVHALVYKHTAPDFGTARHALLDLNVALRELSPHVNLTRLQCTGRLALHAALARHVLPGKYPRLVVAVADICSGKHQRTRRSSRTLARSRS